MFNAYEAAESFNVTVLKIGMPTETGRIYTQESIDVILDQFDKQRDSFFGEMITGNNKANLDISKASHQVINLWSKEAETGGHFLKATIRILDTPTGLVLKKYRESAYWGLRVIGEFIPATLIISPVGLSLIALDVYGFKDESNNQAQMDIRATILDK